MDTPKIYVVCLAAFDKGLHHGQWISTNQTIADLYKEIHQMLANSPVQHAEKFAIHAAEGFGNIHLSPDERIESVIQLAAFITQHGELGVALLANYLIEEAERLLSENYYGEYKSQVNFTYALFDECYSAIPQRLRFYFDFEAFARDLFISDFFCVEADGKVHVFSNH